VFGQVVFEGVVDGSVVDESTQVPWRSWPNRPIEHVTRFHCCGERLYKASVQDERGDLRIERERDAGEPQGPTL
jgi:hypothetical protein